MAVVQERAKKRCRGWKSRRSPCAKESDACSCLSICVSTAWVCPTLCCTPPSASRKRYRQSVDKQPDRRGYSLHRHACVPTTPCRTRRRPAPLPVPAERPRPNGTGSLCLRQACVCFAHPPGESRIHGALRLSNVQANTLLIGQAERQRWLCYISQHLPEECFMLLPGHPQSRLSHEIAKRHRDGQFRCLIAPRWLDLLPHNFRVDVITRSGGDSVPAVTNVRSARRTQSTHAHHRRLANIEPVVPRVEAGNACCATSPAAASTATSSTASLAFRHTTCTGSGNPSHSTAVRRMSCRSITACSAPKYPSSAASCRNEAKSIPDKDRPRSQQMMKQDAFLQRGQRIDVLNVGRTPGNRGSDANDLVGGPAPRAGPSPAGWRRSRSECGLEVLRRSASLPRAEANAAKVGARRLPYVGASPARRIRSITSSPGASGRRARRSYPADRRA